LDNQQQNSSRINFSPVILKNDNPQTCSSSSSSSSKKRGRRSRLLADSKQRSVLLKMILCAGMYAATTLAFVPGSPFYLGNVFKQTFNHPSSLTNAAGGGPFGAPLGGARAVSRSAPLQRLNVVSMPPAEDQDYANGTVFAYSGADQQQQPQPSSSPSRSGGGDDGLIVNVPTLPTEMLTMQTLNLQTVDVPSTGGSGGGSATSVAFDEGHLKLTDGPLALPELDILGMPNSDADEVVETTSEAAAAIATKTLRNPKAARGVKRLMRKATLNVATPKWDLSKKKMDEVKAVPVNPEEEISVDVKHEILTMTLPLLAVWLSSPILSIIDTIVVGRTAGLHELAALGPATAVCDTGTYFFNFLCIVTTAKVANALVRKDAVAEKRGVGDGIMAATAMGALYSGLLLSPLGAKFLGLFTSAGGAGIQEAFGVALGYVRIRAVGMVFALCGAVYQSACLARHNTLLPLVSVASAALFNLVFDCVLVLGMGKGAAGAAWASVAAQAAAFLVLARNERKVSRELSAAVGAAADDDDDNKGGSDEAAPAAAPAAALCDLDSRSLRDRVTSAASFLKECVSPASALAGKAMVVMMHTASVSGTGSSVALAAHQCLYAVLCLFTPFGEALSQTVQSILPKVNQESALTNSRRLTMGARKLVKGLLLAGAGLGAANGFVGGSIPLFFSGIFTSDAAVAAQMGTVAPLVMAILTFHAISTTLEGVLFTSGDGKFLGKFYPVNCAIVSSVFLFARAKHAPLMTLWTVMFSYNFVRVLVFSARTLYNQRFHAAEKTPPCEVAATEERKSRVEEAVSQQASNLDVLENLLGNMTPASA
jgi:Na+-driven multidrug efflux pump